MYSNFIDHSYELVVQNTGEFNPGDESEGFGISSTQSRLKLIYGKDATFEIKNIQPHLVEARILIPFST